jgi:hypothetical protein
MPAWRRSSESDNFFKLPAREAWQLDANAAYVHYTPNETIQGVEFHDIPDVGNVPLVADMSSNILSRPVDVSKFGLIYAGAQKNIGASGLVVLIVREDLLARCPATSPKIFNYAAHAKEGSMLNTPPPSAGIWRASCSSGWRARAAWPMERRNDAKAKRLYDYIDGSGLLQQPDRRGRALAHERAVPPCRRAARRRLPEGKRRPPDCWRSRAIVRSAACAPASTTPCRWPASMHWSISCAISRVATVERAPCTRSDPEQHFAKRPEATAGERYRIVDALDGADAVLVRSADMHAIDIPASVLAIARAGAGTNNIPSRRCRSAACRCSTRPGANANAVKELVLAGMLLSARNIADALAFSASLPSEGGEELMEKEKKRFVGSS